MGFRPTLQYSTTPSLHYLSWKQATALAQARDLLQIGGQPQHDADH
jgi:hypothetical protein